MAPVIIVGGGIAGLSAAFELHRRAVPFLLLEAGSRAGGVVLSEQVDGFTIDAGPDSLLIQKPEGHPPVRGARHSAIASSRPSRRGSRSCNAAVDCTPLPAASVLGIPTRWGPFIRTPLFSWAGKLRMGLELGIPRREADDDESIGAFMERRFGREAKEYLAEPLLAGIHAGDVDRLSLRSLFPRFREAERKHGSVLRGFRKERGRRTCGSAGSGASGSRRRLPLAARRPERDGRGAGPRAALVVASAEDDGHRDQRGASACYRVATAGGQAFTSEAVVVGIAGLRRRAPPSIVERRARRTVRPDPVYVDGDDRAGLPAKRGRPSAQWIGLRRAAGRAHRNSRGVVALVEMAASRARRVAS